MRSDYSAMSSAKRQAGAAIIEFAVTLPLFIAVLLATIDFSHYLNDRVVLSAAAYNGAKAGARSASCGNQGWAQQAVSTTLDGMLSVPGTWSLSPAPQLSGPPEARRYMVSVQFEREPSMMSLFTANIAAFETINVRGVAVCQ